MALKEFRIHGRGGQGAVLAAELLAVAAYEDGKYGQAFPAFGGERRGAPVKAFFRMSETPIRLRHRVYNPDYLLVLDPSLLDQVDIFQGLQPGGIVLVNSKKTLAEMNWPDQASVCLIPATQIGMDVFGKPLVNPAMLGALAAVSAEISLSGVQNAFRHRFPGEMGNKNAQAAQIAFDWVRSQGIAPIHVDKHINREKTVLIWDENTDLGIPGRPLDPAVVVAPRTSLAYPTGTWRYNRPVFKAELCSNCGLCDKYCPDSCILVIDEKRYADERYCKGCGICAYECPRQAVTMVMEEA